MGKRSRSVVHEARPATVVVIKSVSHRGDIKAWIGIFCVTFLAYWPALRGGLLWDDAAHVTKPELQSIQGLWRIWFELRATQQYYPLLHSAFWLEHRIWGDSVLGYHLANVALHALAACLVMTIVRRLSLPGAWLAGFTFALHPVCVEAVAWISEQKSTLSAVFYLGSALAYFSFDRTRRRSRYFVALGLFVLALLSKTVTATLPAALLVVLWWKRGRLDTRRDAAPLLPWFGLSAAAGILTAWIERTFIGATGADFDLTMIQRLLIAGRVIWFYAAKLVWPVNLMFTYPHWEVDPGIWWQYLFPIGVVAAATGLWIMRRRDRGPLAGFLIFAGTLFPVLGFLNVYPFRYSYVADHFQYLAMLGIIVPAASWLAPRAGRTVPVILLLILGMLTWRQSAMYRDIETLYRETLARNPLSWMAHYNLANALSERPGRLPDAIAEYEAALRIRPAFAEGHNNLGSALSQMPGRQVDAIAEYREALRIEPGYAKAHYNLGNSLSHFPDKMPEAIAEYQAALRLNPEYFEAHHNLGNALAQIPARLPEAIAEYQAALRINPDYAEAHNSLGNAWSQTGKLPDAVAEYETAIQLKPDYAEARFNLAGVLSEMPGRLPDAIAEYRALLRIQPDSAEAHNNLGTMLAQTPGGLAEAITEYEAAVHINPNYAKARYNLANALAETPGRVSDAIVQYKAALRIDPNYAEAHANLGSVLSQIPGRLPEAIAEYQAALRLQPDLEQVRQILQRLLAAQH